MTDLPAVPDHRALAQRLSVLAKRTRQGRLTDPEVTYLAAVLDHYYDTTSEWRKAR